MEKSKRLQYIIMGLCFIAVPFLEVLGGLSQKLIAIIGIAFAALMIYLIVFRQTKNDTKMEVSRNSLLAGFFLGLGIIAGTVGVEMLIDSTLSPASMVSMLNGCCCITFGIRVHKVEPAEA